MGAEWKELKADGLDQIERGINGALDELRELGSIGDAGAGRGFENVSLSSVQLGHTELAKTFQEFCDRWEWGVRALLVEGTASRKVWALLLGRTTRPSSTSTARSRSARTP
ncbi:hypothetical protein [Streptomyces cavernicola]|uniref:Uncharacterized protein n=1 Tax=Streptomyces cavernicola TaxID=3043613 RepID=A0ABT6SD69_9ACTN|nr:hypothetical protein [Streptomyces sp. B-S-A6]MDI3405915.1 hypothetical protein [Streptomyces sp. B-S-A6]